MTTTIPTAELTQEIIRLTDGAALATPFSQRHPGFVLAEGYRIAREVLTVREGAGWQRIGRKIGFSNRTILEQYGVAGPMFGYMYDRTLREAVEREGQFSASLPLTGLAQPLIEPEIAFRLRSRPPVTRDPEELLRHIEWVAHGFEVVQCHFPGWKFAAADAVADGGLHGRYILGPRRAVAEGDPKALAAALGAFTITLLKNGEPAAEGGGANVLDSPLNALAFLIETIEGLPGHPPLAAGEIITTGTLTKALPVTAGETWSTRLEGLPLAGLELRFE
ncbi:MAG: hydratase [Dehalococcoidia bacterium]|nr:hydratase [Dehalococcoidia bacterium]